MKILNFTFEAPSRMYGGGIGIIQTLSSLCSFADVTYVGPEFDRDEFPELRISDTFFLRESKSMSVKAANLLRGLTTRYYQAWKAAAAEIDPSYYDLAVIDFSYNDFVERWAHKNGLRTVVRVHNIEQDMSYNSLHGKQHDRYWLRNRLNISRIVERERRCMVACDRLVFLTDEDRLRASELYGEQVGTKGVVVPVCVDVKHGDGDASYDAGRYVLATGSLYYGPNAEGIRWLIEEVWPLVKASPATSDLRLVVAGRRPTPELRRAVEQGDGCELIDTPLDISPYFRGAALYAAPIFTGAGMKVKVAEALSYGLQVVGTEHSLIGYEEASAALYEAESAEDFAKGIVELVSTPRLDKGGVGALYNSLFTLNRSAKDFESVVRDLV